MALIRAYIFASSVSNDNNAGFNDAAFLSACARFAIDNPVPSVSLRCHLYGNSRDIMKVLGEAEKKYGKASLKFDKNLYTEADLIQAPVSDAARAKM
jgi:hypothetical protein